MYRWNLRSTKNVRSWETNTVFFIIEGVILQRDRHPAGLYTTPRFNDFVRFSLNRTIGLSHAVASNSRNSILPRSVLSDGPRLSLIAGANIYVQVLECELHKHTMSGPLRPPFLRHLVGLWVERLALTVSLLYCLRFGRYLASRPLRIDDPLQSSTSKTTA